MVVLPHVVADPDSATGRERLKAKIRQTRIDTGEADLRKYGGKGRMYLLCMRLARCDLLPVPSKNVTRTIA
jgi:hypothetical protein